MSNSFDFFWTLADPLLQQKDVDKGTMMGFPCLRINGDFFASAEHKTGSLIAKLPATRVQELIQQGIGIPFAPAGRVFKEWVLVEEEDEKIWTNLLNEAKEFVSTKKK